LSNVDSVEQFEAHSFHYYGNGSLTASSSVIFELLLSLLFGFLIDTTHSLKPAIHEMGCGSNVEIYVICLDMTVSLLQRD
jgi:hypothetical protein